MKKIIAFVLMAPLLWASTAAAQLQPRAPAPVQAQAQTQTQAYPDYESTRVNDFAGLLDTDAEARLTQQLQSLEQDTGVQMTVVTLSRQAVFAPGATLEQFATGLFDTWGIGNKDTNDGVLVLVMHLDRAMRIELGAGYGRAWDRAAATVIDRSFLPAFKEDRYQAGIEAGVTDTINTIVMPFRAGETEPTGGAGDRMIWAIVMTVLGALGLLAFRDKLVALKKCPQCGRRGLHRSRKVLRSASKTMTGSGEMTTTCSNCTYRSVMPYTISPISSSSTGSTSFGGGSSGGGGASGRW